MKRNLGTIVASTALLTSLATFGASCTDKDYRNCNGVVKWISEGLQRLEQKHPEDTTIGEKIPLPLNRDLNDELALCIARGVSEETGERYEVLRMPYDISGIHWADYVAIRIK